VSALAIIPWHSTDPWRLKSMHYVTDHLDRCGVEYILAPGPQPGPFSRAAAKNQGAEWAREDGVEVIIFHDADMIVEQQAYEDLIAKARETGKLIVGFTEYRALTQAATSWLVDGNITDPMTAQVGQVLSGFSRGGIIAVTVEAFYDIGRYDERFRGWGCEDWAFSIAATIVRGEFERLPYPAIHLWHEHGSATQDDNDERFNGGLLARYNQATSIQDLRLVQQTD
jgi:predicted glycosyltransferase involved in capsule biosynthesis